MIAAPPHASCRGTAIASSGRGTVGTAARSRGCAVAASRPTSNPTATGAGSGGIGAPGMRRRQVLRPTIRPTAPPRPSKMHMPPSPSASAREPKIGTRRLVVMPRLTAEANQRPESACAPLGCSRSRCGCHQRLAREVLDVLEPRLGIAPRGAGSHCGGARTHPLVVRAEGGVALEQPRRVQGQPLARLCSEHRVGVLPAANRHDVHALVARDHVLHRAIERGVGEADDLKIALPQHRRVVARPPLARPGRRAPASPSGCCGA